jgi:hypothetical protein
VSVKAGAGAIAAVAVAVWVAAEVATGGIGTGAPAHQCWSRAEDGSCAAAHPGRARRSASTTEWPL